MDPLNPHKDPIVLQKKKYIYSLFVYQLIPLKIQKVWFWKMFVYFVCLDDTVFSQSCDPLFASSWLFMSVTGAWYMCFWGQIRLCPALLYKGYWFGGKKSIQPFRFFVYVLIRSEGAPRSLFVFCKTRSAKHPLRRTRAYSGSYSGAFQTTSVILTLR